MKIRTGKKIGIIVLLLVCIFGIPFYAKAQSDIDVNGIQIIPELEQKEIDEINEKIAEIGKTGGKVNDKYKEVASTLPPEEQLASGIMTWDTIVNYLVYVVKFLSQLGIAVGVVFIMYAGYRYMTSVFAGGKTPTSTVKNAIIGVIIVIFSYAIMRILTSLVGLT